MKNITHNLHLSILSLAVFVFCVSAQNRGVNGVSVKDGKSTASGILQYSGVLNVGVNEEITSLTNQNGLFARLNAGVISGNLIVNITSDLTEETGAIALRQQIETGVGGYTILVQPSGGPRLISGHSDSSRMICLDGADRVTFSGAQFGGHSLTIRNISDYFGGATVRIFEDARNNAFISCIIEGGSRYSEFHGVVEIVATSFDGPKDTSVVGNIIRSRTGAPEDPEKLIWVGDAKNTFIANNQLSDYASNRSGIGVSIGYSENTTISGNTIFQTRMSKEVYAIEIAGSIGLNRIVGNVIRDHDTYLFVGIKSTNNQGMVEISNNRIYGFTYGNCPQCGTGLIFGIEIVGDQPISNIVVRNNMVSFAMTQANSFTFFGLNDGRTAGSLEMTRNTIFIGGMSTGANSWAFRRSGTAPTTVSLVGNLFFNGRDGTGNHFSIGDGAAGAGSWTSDFNLYSGRGINEAEYFDFGTTWNPPTPITFEGWKNAGSGRDQNSVAAVAGTGSITASNIFVSSNDLHLNLSAKNPASDRGTATEVSKDIDGEIRPAGNAPDLGADEANSILAPRYAISGRITDANGRGIRKAIITVRGAGNETPQLLMPNAFGYFHLAELKAGQVYLVTVNSRRYYFSTPSRFFEINGPIENLNFVAEGY